MLKFCSIDPQQRLIYVKANNRLDTVHSISVKFEISPTTVAGHFELQTLLQNFEKRLLA